MSLCPLVSKRFFPGLDSFQSFFLVLIFFCRNELLQVFNEVDDNLIFRMAELIGHLGGDQEIGILHPVHGFTAVFLLPGDDLWLAVLGFQGFNNAGFIFLKIYFILP